jgi:outer membrane immunogenic protein
MKSLLLVVCCAVLASGSVFADHLCGFYGGVHAGYSSLSPDYTEPAFNLITVDEGVDDFSGGLLGGYNRQWCNLLVGLEADFAFTDAQQTQVGDSGSPDDLTVFTVDWYSHLRFRVSSTDDEWRPFFAAGLALARLSVTDVFAGAADRKSSTLTGWSIGGGVDHPVAHNTVLRFEGLYDRFERDSFGRDESVGRWRPDAFTGRVALTWRL